MTKENMTKPYEKEDRIVHPKREGDSESPLIPTSVGHFRAVWEDQNGLLPLQSV